MPKNQWPSSGPSQNILYQQKLLAPSTQLLRTVCSWRPAAVTGDSVPRFRINNDVIEGRGSTDLPSHSWSYQQKQMSTTIFANIWSICGCCTGKVEPLAAVYYVSTIVSKWSALRRWKCRKKWIITLRFAFWGQWQVVTCHSGSDCQKHKCKILTLKPQLVISAHISQDRGPRRKHSGCLWRTTSQLSIQDAAVRCLWRCGREAVVWWKYKKGKY